MRNSLLALTMAVCLGAADSSADSGSVAADSVLFLSVDMVAFLNNLEYFNAYRSGEPFFGAHAQARLGVQPFRGGVFSLGIHIRRDFGDEVFLSDVLPLFRAHLTRGPISFILGELFSRNQHGLLDALLREQVAYRPVVEEGLQFMYKGRLLRQDVWANYPALNTGSHREHLQVGNATHLIIEPVTASLMAYIDHFGGQLFAPPGDPVRENLTGACGITYRLSLSSAVEEIGIEQFLVGSYTSSNRAEIPYESGWGSITRSWLTVAGFEFSLLFYSGNGFTNWQGNTLYQTDDTYYCFQMDKCVRFGKVACLDFGIRLDFVDMTPDQYFDNGDNQIWVVLACEIDRVLK